MKKICEICKYETDDLEAKYCPNDGSVLTTFNDTVEPFSISNNSFIVNLACPKCDFSTLDQNAIFCPNCGTELVKNYVQENDFKVCEICGYDTLDLEAKFCPNCGKSLVTKSAKTLPNKVCEECGYETFDPEAKFCPNDGLSLILETELIAKKEAEALAIKAAEEEAQRQKEEEERKAKLAAIEHPSQPVKEDVSHGKEFTNDIPLDTINKGAYILPKEDDEFRPRPRTSNPIISILFFPIGVILAIFVVLPFGLLNMITTLGVPYFKVLPTLLTPGGRVAVTHRDSHKVRNVLSFISGLIPFLVYELLGVILFFLPIGQQLLKIAPFFMSPHGAEFVIKGEYSSTRNTKYDKKLFFKRYVKDSYKPVYLNDGKVVTAFEALSIQPKMALYMLQKIRRLAKRQKVRVRFLTIINVLYAVLVCFSYLVCILGMSEIPEFIPLTPILIEAQSGLAILDLGGPVFLSDTVKQLGLPLIQACAAILQVLGASIRINGEALTPMLEASGVPGLVVPNITIPLILSIVILYDIFAFGAMRRNVKKVEKVEKEYKDIYLPNLTTYYEFEPENLKPKKNRRTIHYRSFVEEIEASFRSGYDIYVATEMKKNLAYEKDNNRKN